jgi:hypothetical protein
MYMIFDPRIKENSPESLILDILARKPRLSSKELFGFFNQKYPAQITIQGFYKIIKKMLINRILLKEGHSLSLDSFWINKVIEFSKTIEQTYLALSSNNATILLEEGENKTYEFENILTMDNLWEHGLNMARYYYIKHEHRDKNAYSRNYYAVFHITRAESEMATLQYFESSEMQWYMASGSNTFLNKLPTKIIEKENYHHFIFDFEKYIINNPIEKNYWVTIIGDYIFEARFPKYIFELIENIYNNTQNISEFNADKISALFREPGKSILTISKNKKKAEIIRNEIKKLYEEYKN